MPDWNKEIKLSGLVRRGQKAPKKPSVEVAAIAEAPADKKSFLKKEINLSLRRKDKAPTAPKPARPSRKEARAAKKEAREAAEEPKAPNLARRELRAAKKETREAEKAAKPTRAERLAAKKEQRQLEKAAQAAKRNAPKEPRRAGRRVATVPAVPIMRAFNLLPRDDARDAAGRRPNTAQLVLAVVALIGLAVLGAYFLMLNASVADKRAEADSLRAAAAARPNPAVPEPSAEDETNTALQDEQNARTAALAGALGRRVAWDRLLREFSLVVPDDVSLTKLTASGGGTGGAAADPAAAAAAPLPESTFTIEGYTKTQEAVARLLARLSVLPELSAVDLESSTATVLGVSKVYQFVIRTTVKPVSGSTL